MKKTYITTMPDDIGAFLRASRLFASLGINITRVSYNKAVDSHTLFIDAEADPQLLSDAEAELEKIGYIGNERADTSIVLLEFKLPDVPGSVTDVLSLISEFNFNISYISSQENGGEYQLFKMGLYVEEAERVSEFISCAQKICPVRVLDYNRTEKSFDNSIFYNTFVSSITAESGITKEKRDELLIFSNLAMQMLDERGLSPYRTFDSIGKIAEMLTENKGAAFSVRITRHRITDSSEIILIEPPCGSNTAIIKSAGEVLFVDCGYALYKDEMQKIFRDLFPDWDDMKKTVLVTHADVDHCGLLFMFDRILASEATAECLRLEYECGDGFREKNEIHRPYIKMCKILTAYAPPDPDKIEVMWKKRPVCDAPIVQVGFICVGELCFEVYEGQGGHLVGEIALVDYEHHVAFTGDIYVNLKEMTPAQAQYNKYAPILMAGVDTDAQLCRKQRNAIMQRLGTGAWQIFGAHGYKKDYSVNVEK